MSSSSSSSSSSFSSGRNRSPSPSPKPSLGSGHRGDDLSYLLMQPEDFVLKLHCDSKTGLSKAQASSLLSKHGPNELPHTPPTPLWKLILEQFKDNLVIILLVAAFVSFLLASLEYYENMGDSLSADGNSSSATITAFVEPFVILLILVANATVGVIQESNAEKAIDALKSYTPDEAKVFRDGRLERIPARELVPGDIIELAVGDKVPADARVISVSSSDFRADQAILTGESVSVHKSNTALTALASGSFVKQDMVNVLFSGTAITTGRARAIVFATGSNTAIGHIHSAISKVETEPSPLKQKLDEFGDKLAKLITVICILVWIINFRHFNDPIHHGWLRGAVYYFKIAVALAVAAIPEGLAVVITTCLALGTKRMAKNNAIVRTLPSVETLGSTSVICSDKTGTLTTNMMTSRKLTVFDGNSPENFVPIVFKITGNSYDPNGEIVIPRNHPSAEKLAARAVPLSDPVVRSIIEICVLCNDSSIQYVPETDSYKCVGEPTESSLHVLAEKFGTPSLSFNEKVSKSVFDPIERASACNNWYNSRANRIKTFEFSRDRKSMSVVVSFNSPTPTTNPDENGTAATELVRKDLSTHTLLVKGAPESLLERSSKIRLSSGSTIPLPADSPIRKIILAHYEEQATKSALRVLAFAMASISDDNSRADWRKAADSASYAKVEQNLTFLGLVAMQDPARPEVAKAVQRCKTAGIRVIVVTGDNKATAEAICRDIGLFAQTERSVDHLSYTGRQWESFSATEKKRVALRARLFSRVEPTHKQELVSILQESGHVVAMTGDGVNDAPALRSADIGVAMGSGTDVAKLAADMVLTDDNFSSIVAAVREGRSIYDNTKQFIRYLISSNIGEVVAIFLTVLLGMPEALIPVQLLWVNLVTDGLPATALGFNPPDIDIMQRPPRSRNEPIVTRWLFIRYLVVGLYVGAATVGGYAWWFMYYEQGPKISFSLLSNYTKCSTHPDRPASGCETLFAGEMSRRATTVSLSVLVVIEMLNAMNSLSENSSLLAMPLWRNIYLILAIMLSMTLHLAILYVPALSTIFGIEALTCGEWIGVLLLSAPVLVIDEFLKLASRLIFAPTTPAAVTQKATISKKKD